MIPENAVLSEKEFYVDQNVSIKCRQGFLLKGQGVMTCNPDETWTQTNAKCESKSASGNDLVWNVLLMWTILPSLRGYVQSSNLILDIWVSTLS